MFPAQGKSFCQAKGGTSEGGVRDLFDRQVPIRNTDIQGVSEDLGRCWRKKHFFFSDRKFGNDGKTCYFCIVMAAHNELGAWGEELAANYLQRKGYQIVERNWKSGHRDIDIIAMDGSVMVFVEVKTRRNRMFVEPEEAIDYMKLRNLRASINHYVNFKHIGCDIRLDAITIIGTPESGSPDIDHILDFPIY